MMTTGRWRGWAFALMATAAATGLGLIITPRFDLVNVAMVYLLAVVVVAYRYARGPAVLACVLGVATFDFLFVPPAGTLSVNDLQYLLTFGIMLLVGLLVAGLMDRLRHQAQERAALEIAGETERIRSALLASISHDLRTPLAVMTGASSALAENGEHMSGAERDALARSVYEQARDMSDRVADVLQMARLETATIKLERDWADMADIVSSVLGRMTQRLSTHRLVCEVPPDLPLVRVNDLLIEQALTNLLENAVRHTPAGTFVRLTVRADAGELVVSVEDFGPGLPPGDVERLFAKFERGTLEASGGGLGLGLAICRAIAQLHGGRIWAERIPAAGTAFRLALPLEAVPPVPLEVPSC